MSTVTVYVTSICGYCVRAKRLLSSKGVPFEEVSLDGDWEGRQALVRRTGQRTVPQIFGGETHVGGSDELHALNRSGELDALLDREGIQHG